MADRSKDTGFLRNLIAYDESGNVTIPGTLSVSGGTPVVTQTSLGTYLSTNTYATESYVTTAVANLVAAAPGTLNTLNELATALGNDPNFATTVTNSIAAKLPLTGGTLTGGLTGTTATFSGSVGIGTASPSAFLHMVATGVSTRLRMEAGAPYAALLDFHNGATARWSIGIDNTQTYGKLENRGLGTDAIRFYDSTNNLVLVPSSGYVGIGTTSPDRRLRVASDGNSWITGVFAGAGGADVLVVGNLSGPTIGGHNSSLTAWAPLLINPDGGSVGIGTRSPQYKLTVLGDINIGMQSYTINNDASRYSLRLFNNNISGSPYIKIGSSYSANYGDTRWWRTSVNAPTDGSIIWEYGVGALLDGSNNEPSSWSEKIRIKADGSVITHGFLNLTEVVSQSDTTASWPILSFSGANGSSGVTKAAGTYDWGVIKASTGYGYYGRVVGGYHASSSIDQGFITSSWTMQFIVNGSNGNAFLRGTLTQGSDARLKANVADLSYGLTELMQLRPVVYNRKKFEKDSDGNIISEAVDTTSRYIGFIAQEVKPLIPEVVNGDENSTNPERGLSIEYQNMVALLTKAIQEQQAHITNLETRLAALETN